MGPLEQHGMPLVVRDLAAEMLPGVPRLAREMTDHLFANMPELVGSRDDDLYAETLASVQANVDHALRLLRLGADVDAIVLPVEAVEYTRNVAWRNAQQLWAIRHDLAATDKERARLDRISADLGRLLLSPLGSFLQ